MAGMFVVVGAGCHIACQDSYTIIVEHLLFIVYIAVDNGGVNMWHVLLYHCCFVLVFDFLV